MVSRNQPKLKSIDTGHGILLVPITPFEDLFGVDDMETARKIVEGIHEFRKKDLLLED